MTNYYQMSNTSEREITRRAASQGDGGPSVINIICGTKGKKASSIIGALALLCVLLMDCSGCRWFNLNS